MRYHFDSKHHVHTLDGKPLIGTSRVGDVLAKPLTWWASGKACEVMGWLNPKTTPPETCRQTAETALSAIKMLNVMGYMKLLDKAYRAHSVKLKDSAVVGTDMHETLENYSKFVIEDQHGQPREMEKYEHPSVEIFAKWCKQNVKTILLTEAHCYSEFLWLGGIVDCVVEDRDGKIAVVDFKSSKEAYPTQFWQATGYAMQLEENGAHTPEGDKILDIPKVDYVVVFPFGASKPEAKYSYDMSGNKEAFLAALTLLKKLEAMK